MGVPIRNSGGCNPAAAPQPKRHRPRPGPRVVGRQPARIVAKDSRAAGKAPTGPGRRAQRPRSAAGQSPRPGWASEGRGCVPAETPPRHRQGPASSRTGPSSGSASSRAKDRVIFPAAPADDVKPRQPLGGRRRASSCQASSSAAWFLRGSIVPSVTKNGRSSGTPAGAAPGAASRVPRGRPRPGRGRASPAARASAARRRVAAETVSNQLGMAQRGGKAGRNLADCPARVNSG